MTGGRVVVLGPTGRNFAAGMSGGIAYVYDPHDTFAQRVNYDMVDLEQPDADDLAFISGVLVRHRDLTGSTVAAGILETWDTASLDLRKVMPKDYKRVLAVIDRARRDGLSDAETNARVMESV